ncbi:MAG: nitroreductase family deazaflavin-dependent oxidoreductase [Gammaproteobacteria bacterium]|nr:nitroreductase family deazaflavin-dependent oxidoreductase [Gammaproteobacteria bacterium]MCP5198474.1 nitroreductase family deazaflavin-dependent oxidoreductase [Gammaproteobacteria bacterium]
MSNDPADDAVATLAQGAVPDWIQQHLREYRESGGARGHLWDATAFGGDGPLPCLLLTTVGRRSGQVVTHPLLYGEDGERYVIVGSKGGADTHPAWYFNLRAQPRVELQVGAEVFAAEASLATGAERTRLWEMMANLYPPYRAYQAKTTREIPIFVLTRVTA